MSAIDIIKSFEGCRLAAYQDVRGIWTIGYGHIRGVYPGLTCTQAQADQWLDEDIREARSELLDCSPGPFAPGALDALISFVFNLGVGNYRSSTLRQFVDNQDWPSVKRELLKWDHSGGQVIAGLLRRRQAESDLITEFA
jgi:lysozyme